MPQGKLVVIEGPDGCGKTTQQVRLAERLAAAGVAVAAAGFPQRCGPVGDLITAYLAGHLGSLTALPPEVPALLYALDRYAARTTIRDTLLAGQSLILSRYWPSNVAFQAAKVDPCRRGALAAWIERLDDRMPPADLVVLLDADPNVLRARVDARGAVDQHEADLAYQIAVRRIYGDLAIEHRWPIVDALQAPADVEAALWALVAPHFGLPVAPADQPIGRVR